MNVTTDGGFLLARNVSMYLSNPVVVGDTLFGLSRRGRGEFFALDAKVGNVLWTGPPRAAENAAFVKAGDLLFILKDDGELIVARASRNGSVSREQGPTHLVDFSARSTDPAM